MSTDDLAHGIRTLSVPLGPDDFTKDGIDEGRLLYAASLNAAHQGIDLLAYDVTDSELGPSMVDDQPGLSLTLTLTPRREPVPPEQRTLSQRLRVVGA